MNKIDAIKALKLTELREISHSIFEKLGYSDVKDVSDDCLIGQYKTPIGKDLHGMVIVMDKLSGGKVEASRMEAKLESLSTKNGFHTCIVLSQGIISQSVKSLLEQSRLNLQYIDRDELIQLIDEHQPNYWHHKDTSLLDYEKHFCDHIIKETELKKLKIFNDKYKRLIDIFIEPRIYQLKHDPESDSPSYKRSSLIKLCEKTVPTFITGEAGTGKTTILKKIGETLIEQNRDKLNRKRLPVFVTQTDLIDGKEELSSILESKFRPYFSESVTDLFSKYEVSVLIDSIDEFDSVKQSQIITQLETLQADHGVKYYVASRQYDNSFDSEIKSKPENFLVEKFDNAQIKQFVSKFFSNSSRGEALLDSLRDNRILEQLPITPLSLSLIAILFEERDFEIPATITDIYDNFNILLLGKAAVTSRYEFIDINFKERILSLYAYELLNSEQKKPLTVDQFHGFFRNYFESKTLPIEEEQLNDMLDYLIRNSGLLYVRDQKYVQFKHDSFMEYYAAIEIFKHKREDEDQLVEKFFDLNWQNTAVFYAGKSRDMAVFLEKVIDKVQNANLMPEFLSGVMGLGYLLQALYQTDNLIRKRGVDIALEKNLEAFEVMKKMAADENVVAYKRMKLPIIAMFNLLYFYENYNSITLKDPLSRSFSELRDSFKEDPKAVEMGFKALKIATVLRSNRIGDSSALESLVYDTKLLNNPMLNLLADFSLEFDWTSDNGELKKEVKKHGRSLNEPIKSLFTRHPNSLRFTTQDQIQMTKKFRLITEGKTDSEIIEHAYMILTGNQVPYWTIAPAGNIDGGASELTKTLMNGKPLIESDQLVIGIYDNDAKGIQEFNGGLRPNVFKLLEDSKRIKKHVSKDIYAMKLPIPADRHNYIHDDQNFNFFCIEHYFEDNVLREQGILSDTPIDNIFKIKNGKKKSFSKFVRQQSEAALFKQFIDLFREIDCITGNSVEYTY